MAHPKHNEVRRRYDFRCGYYGVSETDSGSELTVDHFQPTSAGGTNEDDNLVYACPRCNQYKSDFFPDASDLQAVRRILHPLRDDLNAHYRVDAMTQWLIPLTPTGAFHIELLLNRAPLIAARQQREMMALLVTRSERLAAENQALREQNALLRLLSQYEVSAEEL